MEKPFDPLEYEKLGYWKMFDEFSSRNRTEIVEKMSNNEEKKKDKVPQTSIYRLKCFSPLWFSLRFMHECK